MSNVDGARPNINWAFVLVVAVVTMGIVLGSVVLLPTRLVDYGILFAVFIWASAGVVSQWKASPTRRLIGLLLAPAFFLWMMFVLWPLHQPM